MKKLQIEETMLLVIDVQEKLLSAIKDSNKMLERTVKLIKGAQVLGLPIVITEQYPKGLGRTVKKVSELLPEITPIEKTSFSCMGEEAFKPEIAKAKRKNIIICGAEAHVCVYQTAIDLLSKGYGVSIAVDCVSSREKADKKTVVAQMTACGINITTAEMALFELLGSANHPQFKEISKIVK